MHLAQTRLTIEARCLLMLMLCFAGCGKSERLDDAYGTRRGAGAKSVNGTSVLSDMFEDAGFRVSSWRRLSPKLNNEQVIAWVPNRFRTPYPDEVKYLTQWLTEEPYRTLIYVGRDYDAAMDYWQRIEQQAPADEQIAIRRHVARLKSRHASRRAAEFPSEDCQWFRLQPAIPPKTISRITGPWSSDLLDENVQVWSSTQMELNANSSANRRAEIDGNVDFEKDDNLPRMSDNWEASQLLIGPQQELVAGRLRHIRLDSQLIVIPNGSWLLNLPLINHQHRRLAGRMIDECGPPARVCFLESGQQTLGISESDTSVPMILRVFTVFPFNIILLHLLAIGLLYCFSVLPIFGRPIPLPEADLSDFGQHVAAVGDMLERGQHKSFATEQIEHYHEIQKQITR